MIRFATLRLMILGGISEGYKNLFVSFFEWLGDLGVFCARVMRAALTPPYEGRELIRQMDEVGSKSLDPRAGLHPYASPADNCRRFLRHPHGLGRQHSG